MSRRLFNALTLCLACAAAEPVPARDFDPRTTLRVATWNVNLGHSLGVAPGAAGVSKALNSHSATRGAEVLALQELCGNGGGWQLRYFAEAMEEQHGRAYTAFIRVDPNDPMMCERGQAIVSAWPIEAYGRVELPRVRQTRAFLWADLLVPNARGEPSPLRVYVPHFENRASTGSGASGRVAQARAVLMHLLAWREGHPGTPVLVMGDLNSVGHLFDPGDREPAIELLSRHLDPSLPDYQSTMPTWPWQVDWIFSAHLELAFSTVAHIEGSDHWPVTADFLRPGGG